MVQNPTTIVGIGNVRVVCDFLHDASSERSRNRMQQSYAKVVLSKSALMLVTTK